MPQPMPRCSSERSKYSLGLVLWGSQALSGLRKRLRSPRRNCNPVGHGFPWPSASSLHWFGVSRGFARLQSNYNQFRSGELHRATRPRLPRQHYNPVVHGLPWPSAPRFHWSGVSRGLAPLRSIKLQSISVVSAPTLQPRLSWSFLALGSKICHRI